MRIPRPAFSISLMAMSLLGFAGVLRAQTPVKISEDATRVVWRIDRPEVRAWRKTYPAVEFKQYDEVKISAGGSVNVGGWGWGLGKKRKRYVDPSGESSDRLYHGRILIPGATDGLVRISSILNRTLIVDLPPHYDGGPLYLQVGYEDDHYGDNSYGGHDNGSGNQCQTDRDGGPAWIEIAITHHAASAGITRPKPASSLDLWWERIDENSLPLNPVWGAHLKWEGDKPVIDEAEILDGRQTCNNFKNDGGKVDFGPKCTTWNPDVDEPKAGKRLICDADHGVGVHGHINWGPATYTGKVFFQDYQVPPVLDGDYDLELIPDEHNRAIVLHGNEKDMPHGGITLEFQANETIKRFQGQNTWWKSLKNAVDQDSRLFFPFYQHAHQMVNGLDAILIGLLGIDNQHDAHTELHPVYGLALKTKTTAPREQVWAIFARNWGSEGECSQYQHYLPFGSLRFFFPYLKAGTTLSVLQGGTSGTRFYPGRYTAQTLEDGLMLTLPLSDPEAKASVYGELHLREEEANLIASIQASSGAATNGELTYTVNIQNQGPDSARFVRLTENLPSTLAFKACRVSGDPTRNSCVPDKPVVLISEIAPATFVTATFVTKVSCSLPDAAIVANNVDINSATRLLNPSSAHLTVSAAVSNPPPVIAASALRVGTGPEAKECHAKIVDSVLRENVQVIDNCDGWSPLRLDGVPKDNLFPVGSSTIQYTTVDSGGASGAFTRQVLVVDDTPPSLRAPADQTFSCLAQVPVALPTDATASDNCGPPAVSVSESNNGGAGSPTSPLIITRTYEAVDAAGNKASAAQKITVVESAPPVISNPSVEGQLSAGANQLVPVTLTYTASGSCPLPVNACKLGVTPVEPASGSAADWEILDDHHLKLRAGSGSRAIARKYTVTVTCTNAAGNTSTARTDVSVEGSK